MRYNDTNAFGGVPTIVTTPTPSHVLMGISADRVQLHCARQRVPRRQQRLAIGNQPTRISPASPTPQCLQSTQCTRCARIGAERQIGLVETEFAHILQCEWNASAYTDFSERRTMFAGWTILPSSGGIEPLNRLSKRNRCANSESCPSSGGISPDLGIRFSARTSDLRVSSLPIDGGISPVKSHLPRRFNHVSLLRLPSSDGIGPLSWLNLSDNPARLARPPTLRWYRTTQLVEFNLQSDQVGQGTKLRRYLPRQICSEEGTAISKLDRFPSSSRNRTAQTVIRDEQLLQIGQRCRVPAESIRSTGCCTRYSCSF